MVAGAHEATQGNFCNARDDPSFVADAHPDFQ